MLRRSGWVGSVRRRHAVAACVTYGCSLVAYGCRRFLEATQHLEESDALDAAAASEDDDGDASAAQPVDRAADGAGGGAAGGAALGLEVLFNHVRVAPQYSLAALRPGVFLLGMKEQLTVHDLPSHPLYDQVSTAPRRGRVRVCAGGGGGGGGGGLHYPMPSYPHTRPYPASFHPMPRHPPRDGAPLPTPPRCSA